MDKIIPGVVDLIKNPLLFLVIIGLGLCLVAALGQWPGSQSAPIALGWQLVLVIIGLVVAGPSAFFLVRDLVRTSGAASKSGFSLEGKYFAEGDLESVNVISPLSENVYKVKGLSWEGVGFVDGDFYYGIYKYSDNPECANPGSWGAHRAEIRLKELRVTVIELSKKFEDLSVGVLVEKTIPGKLCTWKKASI